MRSLYDTVKTLPHVMISSTISLTMPTSTMEFNEIVDDEPATSNDIVNDADVKYTNQNSGF